jgi:hypothetical protein
MRSENIRDCGTHVAVKQRQKTLHKRQGRAEDAGGALKWSGRGGGWGGVRTGKSASRRRNGSEAAGIDIHGGARMAVGADGQWRAGGTGRRRPVPLADLE